MKTLKLNDIRKDFGFEIQKNMYIGKLRDWIGTHKYGYIIDFDVFLPSKNKNLQRGFVWTLDQKRELIMSVIKGIDIQAISVIISTDKHKEKTFKVIDGKQRLSTLIDFVNDKFTVELCGEEFLFSNLPDTGDPRTSIKYEIASFNIHFNQTYEYWDDLISDDDKIAWFEQINFAGTPQDKEHLENLKK